MDELGDADEAGGTGDLDARILRWLHADGPPGSPWLVDAAADLTRLGDTLVIAVLGLVLAGWLVVRGDRGAALRLLVIAGAARGLAPGLKWLVGRPRPDPAIRLVDVHGSAMPSTHATLAAAAWLAAAGVLGPWCRSRGERAWLLVAAAAIILAVGVTRVVLGVHHPSDVLAGWALGTAVAVAGLRIVRVRRHPLDTGRPASHC